MIHSTGVPPKTQLVFPKLSAQQILIAYLIACGFTNAQMADVLDVPLARIKSRIFRLRQRFRFQYGGGYHSRESIAIRYALKFGTNEYHLPNHPLKDKQHA